MNNNFFPLLDIPYDFIASEDVSADDIRNYCNFPGRIRMAVFLFCVEGAMRVNINMHEYAIEKGQIIVLFPNSLIQVLSVSDNLRAKLISLSADFVETFNVMQPLSPAADVIFRNPIAALSADRTQVFSCAVTMVCQALRVDPEDVRNKLVSNTILSVSTMLLPLFTSRETDISKLASRADDIIRQYYALVLKHHAQEHRLIFYANELNITSSYLCAIVKRKVGITAMQVINRAIITDAKAQLKAGTLPVKTIALSLGFDNPAFFSKFFRAQTGMTPLEFRSHE